MPNMFFQISGFLHTLIIFFVYIRKNKTNTLENYTFRSLILSAMIACLADAISICIGVYLPGNILSIVFGKLYLWAFVTWMIIFSFYISISLAEKENSSILLNSKSEETQMFLKKLKQVMIINVLAIAVLTMLPLRNEVSGIILNRRGFGVYSTYIVSIISIIYNLRSIVKNKNNSNNKLKKAVISFTLFIIAGFIGQILFGELILISFVLAIITIITYGNVENPDLKAIEELNIATQQADSANRAKSDFLSSMSHEIRTPLNAIVGFAQALAKEEISGPAKDEVKEILNASTGLLETINGILDVSKLEARKIEIVKTDYSTRKLINEIVSLANSRLGSKALELKFEIDEKLPPVLYGDYGHIKQIITNLITNAIKYTKYGYVLLKIDALVGKDKCMLTITVEDSGIGMAKEDLDILFDKFQKAESSKNSNILGTGLGMSITKGLVDLMKGELNVQSEPTKGTTFTVVLDQEMSDKVINDIPEQINFGKTTPFNASGQKVLVVDDNKINLKVAERMLSEYQLTLDFCESGRECIDKILNGNKYDLILLDIMMPKMKGPEVLAELKKYQTFTIPVVALTADAVAGMEDKYIEQGFSDSLPKPIVEEELYYLLKKFLKETGESIPKQEEQDELDENGQLKTEELVPTIENKIESSEKNATSSSTEMESTSSLKFEDLPEVNYLPEIMDINPSKIFPESTPVVEEQPTVDIYDDIVVKISSEKKEDK